MIASITCPTPDGDERIWAFQKGDDISVAEFEDFVVEILDTLWEIAIREVILDGQYQ